MKNSLIVEDGCSSISRKAKSVKNSHSESAVTCGIPRFSVCKSLQDYILVELEEEEALILLDLNQHHFHKPLLHL